MIKKLQTFDKITTYPISNWLFIIFNNAFVFPDPETPIINILYG